MTGTLTCLGAVPQHHNLKQVRMHAGHCDSHAVGVCGLRLLLAMAQRLAASPLPQLPGPAAAAWAPAAGRGLPLSAGLGRLQHGPLDQTVTAGLLPGAAAGVRQHPQAPAGARPCHCCSGLLVAPLAALHDLH